jgi:hypothetical protein
MCNICTGILEFNIEPKTYTMHHRHTFESFKWMTVILLHTVSFGYVCLTCWSFETIHSVAVEMITKYHMDTFASHSCFTQSILQKQKCSEILRILHVEPSSKVMLRCAVHCTSMLTKLPWMLCPLKYKRYGLCQSPEASRDCCCCGCQAGQVRCQDNAVRASQLKSTHQDLLHKSSASYQRLEIALKQANLLGASSMCSVYSYISFTISHGGGGGGGDSCTSSVAAT